MIYFLVRLGTTSLSLLFQDIQLHLTLLRTISQCVHFQTHLFNDVKAKPHHPNQLESD